MAPESEISSLNEDFLQIIESEDNTGLHDFLDDQNISEVAELIGEFPEQEVRIINNLSIHRAGSTFKILDLSTQKRIIQELSPQNTAEFLNVLPAHDRTSFMEDLPSEVAKELIKLLNPEERKVTLS